MPVNTLFLLGAVAILLEEAADRDLLLIVHVKVVAIVAPGTFLLDPMHANQLLALLLIDVRGQTSVDS